MKIAIISNLSEGARLVDLQGYNQVYAYHLQKELRAKGQTVELFSDKELPSFPNADITIVLSATGIIKIRDTALGGLAKAIMAKTRLYHLTDGPIRSIVPWAQSKDKGAYIGMGADPAVCYPDQDTIPVVLFNAWNATVDRGQWDDPVLNDCIDVLREIKSDGVEIWSLNVDLDFADKVIGLPVKGQKKCGYVKWLEICRAYRKGWVFLDTTPKVIELGRVEAACCGNRLVTIGVESDDPREGLEHLRQSAFNDKETLFMKVVANLTDIGRAEAVADARSYFNWSDVADRVLGFLNA